MKYILIGYRHPSIKLYTPQKNKKKLGLLGILAIPFLLTPFSNWLYFGGLTLLQKLNPLWLYK